MIVLGFWLIPVRMSTAAVKVQADRRLAFQVLTAWGAARADGRPAAKVLDDSGERLLIEFHTHVNMPLGLERLQRTVEWVALQEPGRIDFEGVKSPIPLLLCHWALEEWGDCTLFKYDATVASHGSIFGWVFTKFVLGPLMERMMREHLEELRQTIEARASRSRVFPQRPCPPEDWSAGDELAGRAA